LVANGLFNERIELLVKQNELQKALLNEVVLAMPKKDEKVINLLNGVMSQDPSQSSILSGDSSGIAKKVLEEIKAHDGDVMEALRQVERMLGVVMMEVGVLRKENEAVRRENEGLKGAGDGMRRDILMLKSEVAEGKERKE
jgi:hypothetical protein